MTDTAKETPKNPPGVSNFIKIQQESWQNTQEWMPGDFAIDIETLSTKSNAAVIEIGFVPFSIAKRVVYWGDRQTWKLSPDLYISSELNNLFDVNPTTVRWWRSEPNAIHLGRLRREGVENMDAAVELLQHFQYALIAYNLDMEGSRIWAKGASFDFPILDNFQRSFPGGHGENKIHYRNYRCARTLWEESNMGPEDWKRIAADEILHSVPGAPHEADWDAAEVAIKVILAKWGMDPLSPVETMIKAIP